MAPELPGGTAIDASGDCIGKASNCGTCADLATEEEILQSCAQHLRVAYNSGKIRPTITVFSPVVPGGVGIRIWNSQLIRYAGYRQGGGSVIGDPLNFALTDALRAMGWQGAQGLLSTCSPWRSNYPASHRGSSSYREMPLSKYRWSTLFSIGLRT